MCFFFNIESKVWKVASLIRKKGKKKKRKVKLHISRYFICIRLEMRRIVGAWSEKWYVLKTSTLDQSGPGSNANKRVLYILKSSRIGCSLVPLTEYHFLQSVYSKLHYQGVRILVIYRLDYFITVISSVLSDQIWSDLFIIRSLVILKFYFH